MATLTSTAAASTGPVRACHAGVNSITATFNDATAISVSATTIFMVKVPNGATILDVIGAVSSGANTCPFTMGISDPTDGGDTSSSLFATGGALGNVVLRASKNLPYDVSVSDDAAVQYQYVTMTVTPGTTTSEVEAKITVTYTLDR